MSSELSNITPLVQNISVYQSSDFSFDITLYASDGTPFDLSGNTVSTKMKRSVIATETTTITSVLSDAINGVITISLTNAQTSALKSGRYIYSAFLVVVADSTKVKFLEGILTVHPNITR